MEQRIIDNLKSLKALLDSGVLTAVEFEAEKSKLLYKDAKQKPQKQGLPVQLEKQPTIQPKTQQETTPKDSEKPACKSCKFNFLLWWAVIYVVAGIVSLLAFNVTDGYFYDDNKLWGMIFWLMMLIRNASNILPVLAIKNKTHKITCAIGVGILSLYYMCASIQDMMRY